VSAATLIASMPLARVPESWPLPVVAAAAMLALAALDFTGAVAAKEWSDGGDAHWLGVGVVAFLLLFYVYASSLRYAELALVTMGWVVLLQVGLLVLDHVRYGVVLAPGKLVAVVLILLLQGYLLVGPSASTGAAS
jgi:hypothetical protein